MIGAAGTFTAAASRGEEVAPSPTSYHVSSFHVVCTELYGFGTFLNGETILAESDAPDTRALAEAAPDEIFLAVTFIN